MRDNWIKHDSLASTSSYISDLLKQQALEEGTVVIADYQEAGRGLGSHSWESRRGENLLMSILLFPAFLSASKQFHISRVASLALCDVLKTLGIDALIKWPNDILSSRGKIAGILIEHSITAGNISHTIVGLGLNVNQTDFPLFHPPASSFRIETGKTAGIYEVGEQVESCLLSRYHALKSGLADQLEREYLEHLFRAGQLAVFKAGKEVFEGKIQGVNEFGELMVEHNGKIRTFAHGAIQMELNFDRT